jgi:pimeloyl-ACP methyl ester carboxylesterase
MKLAADDVQAVVLAGSGHWVAEQAPDQLLAALTAFLAPYREAHNPSAQTAGA